MTRGHWQLATVLFLVAFIINIITCLVVWHYAPSSESGVALHYNVVTGIDELGSRAALYQLPLFGFVILVVNVLLARILGKMGAYIQLTSAGSSLFIAAVVLLSALLLVWQAN